MRSCAFICTCQQWVTMGHALCIYFWLAAGPSSLNCLRVTERTLEWACTCIYSVFSAVAGLPHIWSSQVTEDVLLNLDPHVCSSCTVIWLDSFCLRKAISITSLTCCLNKLLCTFLKQWYVWLFLYWLRAAGRLFSKGNCSFWERESRGRQSERALSASLPLPAPSISFVWLWWIMDEAIDRWAQLCSTDPLRAHIHTIQIWSHPLGKYHLIFLSAYVQSHSSHSHVCQPGGIRGIFHLSHWDSVSHWKIICTPWTHCSFIIHDLTLQRNPLSPTFPNPLRWPPSLQCFPIWKYDHCCWMFSFFMREGRAPSNHFVSANLCIYFALQMPLNQVKWHT